MVVLVGLRTRWCGSAGVRFAGAFPALTAGDGGVIGGIARTFQGHRRGLGYALASLFVLAWVVHLFTGWQEFVAEQMALGEMAFVVLTAILIFEGSGESKDADERLETKVDVILSRLDDLQKGTRSSWSPPPMN